jgi:hypothetical protein
VILERQQAGYAVKLDTSGQTLSLDASVRSASPGPLLPCLGAALKADGFVPAIAFALKARHFERGLFAAVDQFCHPSKARLLETLTQLLTAHDEPGTDEASALLWSGRRMGSGTALACEPEVEERARNLMSVYLADQSRSEPTGYYAWHPNLGKIFRQDRLLGEPLGRNVAGVLARVLREAPPAMRATYDGTLRLAGLLANQFTDDVADLRQVVPGQAIPDRPLHFWSPVRTLENELARKLFGDPNVPKGINMMEIVISAVRARQVRFRPTASTGWFEYQLAILETLLAPEDTPEGKVLEFSRDYREVLEQLFRADIELSGEMPLTLPSHATPSPTPWKAKVELRPTLSVEPLFSYYYRRGMAYSYLRKVLESFFGPQLSGMCRVRPEGPIQETLAVELAKMESLFMGAAEVVAQELDLPLKPRPTSEQDLFWARHWMSDLGQDADLASDDREMVPTRFDGKRKKISVLAHLGYKVIPLSVGYVNKPGLTVIDRDGHLVTEGIEFRPAVYDVLTPVTVALDVPELLEQADFRALCDEAQTESEIAARLGGF